MLYRSVTHLALLLVLLFLVLRVFLFFFFFNDTATTEIYTLSLHDALPIYVRVSAYRRPDLGRGRHAYSWLPARWHSWADDTRRRRTATPGRPQPRAGAFRAQSAGLRSSVRVRDCRDHSERHQAHVCGSGIHLLLFDGHERTAADATDARWQRRT